MIHKHFRVRIIFQVIIIVMLSILTAFVILKVPTLFLPLTLGLIILGLVINLIRYIEKSTRDLTHFLLSIRQGAYTEMYTSGERGKPHAELSSALNEVVREFAALNEEKELHYQHLQALNENIGVGILSFDAEGKLQLMNRAAKLLLKFPALSSINHFKEIDIDLYHAIITLNPEDQKVIRCVLSNEVVQLNIQSREIILNGKKVKILLLQNLNNQLDTKEIDAWHQLMRVLTHEIMNSVTPIASLATASKNITTKDDGTMRSFSTLSRENEEDIFSSLQTIESRSKSLLKFVRSYKEYTRALHVHLENTDLINLCEQVIALLKQDLMQKKIQFEFICSHQSITLKIDGALIEQVIINLLKNAIEAVDDSGHGRITLKVDKVGIQHARLIVSDNGTGIDAEMLPKIFVPFFTTKPKGSGIGLSLSRQIINLHGGSIKATSSNTGTTFTIDL